MNLVASLIIGSIICAAVCQSFLAVGGPKPPDYWPELWKQVPALKAQLAAPEKPEAKKEAEVKKEPDAKKDPYSEPEIEKISLANYDKRDELEKALWADERGEEARAMATEDYLFYSNNNTPLYIKRFRERASMLASMDVSLVALPNAIEIYNVLLERDNAYSPNGVNVYSDYSNLARCYQLQAESSDDEKERKKNFQLAVENLKKAKAGFKTLNDNEAVFTCLTNEYSLRHAMLDKLQAREIFGELRHVKSSIPENLFRDLVLEQQ